VDVRNTGGQTPLVHAQYLGHADIIALLKQHVRATTERE
jgi:hypothetical protein